MVIYTVSKEVINYMCSLLSQADFFNLLKVGKFFKDCYERYELKHKSKHVVLSHYAQAVWNKSHSGSWMLYGHSHATAENWLDQMMPNRFSLDVGVDNIYRLIGEYRPISFEEIEKIFKNRKGSSIDKVELNF